MTTKRRIAFVAGGILTSAVIATADLHFESVYDYLVCGFAIIYSGWFCSLMTRIRIVP